jgi:hypothetical protein
VRFIICRSDDGWLGFGQLASSLHIIIIMSNWHGPGCFKVFVCFQKRERSILFVCGKLQPVATHRPAMIKGGGVDTTKSGRKPPVTAKATESLRLKAPVV